MPSIILAITWAVVILTIFACAIIGDFLDKVTRNSGGKMKRDALLFVGAVFVVCAFCVYACSAGAHDHARPNLGRWYQQQYSGNGPCCDGTDAQHADDTEWDTQCANEKCHYRVRLYNKWWDVPDQAVVSGPNMAGVALVWAVPTMHDQEVVSVFIRCFMPGSGT